jgi:hypothetical protein
MYSFVEIFILYSVFLFGQKHLSAILVVVFYTFSQKGIFPAHPNKGGATCLQKNHRYKVSNFHCIHLQKI